MMGKKESRRKASAVFCVIFLFAIALAAGISFGVVGRGGQKQAAYQGIPTDFSNITSPSTCRYDLCLPVLSLTQFGAGPTTLLVAREAKTNRIFYRRAFGARWASDWEDLDPYEDFYPTFFTPPIVFVKDKRTVSVVGVTTWHSGDKKNDTVAVVRQYVDEKWNRKWYRLDQNFIARPKSTVTACQRIDGEVDMFMLGANFTGSVIPYAASFTEYYGVSKVLTDFVPGSGAWWYRADDDQSSSTMDVDCNTSHSDLVYFKNVTNEQQLFYQRWESSPSLNLPPKDPIQAIPGGFKGQPRVVTRGDRFDVLAVAANGTLYHFYQNELNQTGFQNLDLEVESMPYVIKSNNDTRLDVVVVGTDDRLKHRAYWNGTWAPSWQDLGGVFFSAPLAAVWQPETITVLGLTQNGQPIRGTWEVNDKKNNWIGSGNWTLDSGSLSLES